MKRSVCFMYGSLILVSVASSCLLFILGACEEQQVLVSSVNGTETANWSELSTPRLSDRRRETAVVADDKPVNNGDLKSTTRPIDDTGQDRIRSSFVDLVASATSLDNKDRLEIQEASDIPAEPPKEVGNGLVDTGQTLVQESTVNSNFTYQMTIDNSSWPEGINKSHETNDTERGFIIAEPQVLEVVAVQPDSPPDVIDKPAPQVPSPEEPVTPPSGALSQTPDDIPSFSEWTQKQIEEAEKKKVYNVSTPVSSASAPLKLRSKNYASPDCGAKIVSANPEAQAPSNVLTNSRDEYLLNPCINRIWFVVELCDSIQAKKLEIANFELFSSSPKDFSISVSDRFPTRDWRSVGHFTANDDRDVQSYTLQPHLFGKFIKVELHSHYGSEHFCPVSMIRVYGTTEFEVLETEDELHHAAADNDDEDEAPLIADNPSDPPRNLYGIARDAVKSIVKAAEALVIRTEPVKHLPENSTTDLPFVTPSHIIVCDNCTESLYNSVFDLLSVHYHDVYSFVELPFVYDALRSGPICAAYGLDFGRRRPTTFPLRHDPGDYLSSLLPPHYMVALCNALAVMEKKVVLNVSQELSNVSMCNVKAEFDGFIAHPATTCSVGTSVIASPCDTVSASSNTPNVVTSLYSGDTASVEIKPTRTINISEVKDEVSVVPPSNEPSIIEPPIGSIETNVDVSIVVENSSKVNVTQSENSSSTPTTSEHVDEIAAIEIADVNEEDASFDVLLSELKELDNSPSSTVLTAMTSTLPPQKESVFVRLSNRIKALERNMSLSGQYLEELSRRYKRQVEEMSKTLNRTLALAEMEAKKRDESEKISVEESGRLRERLSMLEGMVHKLVHERDSWTNKVAVLGQHLLLIVIEMSVFVAVWYACRLWGDGEEGAERKWSIGWRGKKGVEERRRSSVDGVSGHQSPAARRKRPSEVALDIKGTYSDLLITKPPMSEVEDVWCEPKADPKRRRRKKKELFSKCASNALLSERKISMQNNVTVREVSTRRASLSELESISIPTNGVRDSWTEPLRIEELNSSRPLEDGPTDESVISVPKQLTKESLGETLPELLRKNGSVSEINVRRLSTPSFMKTAVSSRANRAASEQPLTVAPAKLKSDNWEFWHSSRKSSQNSLAPIPDTRTRVEQNGTGRKKTTGGGLKKMVKRFF